MGLSVKMSFDFGINKQAAEIYPLKVVKNLCLQRLFSTAMTYWLLPAKTPGSCLHCEILHCVKSVRIRSYSGPIFPAFGLNTKRYRVTEYLSVFSPNARKCGPE